MLNSAVWHPFTQHGLDEVIPEVIGAKGATIWTREGRTYIDAISSWWVTTHGHGHPRIMAAIRSASEHLDQIIFAGWTHAAAEELASRLVGLTNGALPRVFYSDSGSTSVEVALKMALGYWQNRGESRSRIVTLQHGYHGDTIGGMSVGERGVYNRPYSPLLFEVGQIPFPVGTGQLTLDVLEAECRGGAAALIVEPLVLGAGGMLTYSPDILAQMRAMCAHFGVLFIADEVMTGWGRTGTMLACEHARVMPDILCLSKGLTGGSLPLAVTLANAEIFDAHRSKDRARMFFHSSSYTANPIACSAAIANLDIWRDEPVLDRIDTLSRLQEDSLNSLPDNARNRRSLGTIAAFELGSDQDGYLSDLGPALRAFFLERNLLLRPLGNTIYVMPPYCIDAEQLSAVYEAIHEAIDHFA